jgi:hypothetical protein
MKQDIRTQIINTLSRLNGAAIGSMNTVTEVKLTGGKKNPMQGRVTKKSKRANVMFFTNGKSNAYRDMVKRRLENEGKDADAFELHSRTWGERVADTPFVEHKGQLYLECIYLRPPKKVTYYLDGQEIEKDAIQGLPVKNEGEQGGLENKVIIRDFKLESIRKIRMGALSVGKK